MRTFVPVVLGWVVFVFAGCLADIDLSRLDTNRIGEDGGSGHLCAPDMAHISAPTPFCIEKTEVTRAAYRAFLSAHGVVQQPRACNFNQSFMPSSAWPPEDEQQELPVVFIDWCDARAYCSWKGRRLCGRVGGGSLRHERAGETREAEWAFACSRGGERVFPYGNEYDEDRCRGGTSNPARVRSKNACVGGFEEVFDMSGNVAEWIDACNKEEDEGGANDVCVVMGGAYDEDRNDLACFGDGVTNQRRGDAAPTIGFRCCKSL